jgi:hypothetical protein
VTSLGELDAGSDFGDQLMSLVGHSRLPRTGGKFGRIVAQKSGTLCGKDILKMINRIAARDGIYGRPHVCSESFLITPGGHSIRGIVLAISGRGTAAEFNASSIAAPS